MVKTKTTTYKLDKDEQELLDSVNRGEWKTIDNLKEEKKRYQLLARNASTKSKNINLRLQPWSLEKLKESAVRLGMPYQTLASSILHRYATGQTILPNT